MAKTCHFDEWNDAVWPGELATAWGSSGGWDFCGAETDFATGFRQ
jgi:hypothetical protein